MRRHVRPLTPIDRHRLRCQTARRALGSCSLRVAQTGELLGVWFLLLGLGAAYLHRLRLPGALAALPFPPPAEARYALYFLLAVELRLTICAARVRALERRARRAAAARRTGPFAVAPPGLLEVGAGVGKGVAEAVMGNFLGVALAGGALLLRLAAQPDGPKVTARRTSEKRRAVARERRRAAWCIVGVGAVCVVAVWLPLVQPRLAPFFRAGMGALVR